MNRFHRWYCCSRGWAHEVEGTLVPWVVDDVDLGDDVIEIGPGPGMTTDALRRRVARLTSVEIDERLASRLAARLAGTNVTVVHGDATQLPFAAGTFSGATAMTMLHHVPSAVLQDRLLAEVCRVLRPGAVFTGSDSRWSRRFQLYHLFDTMTLVDPERFADRLLDAGFVGPQVDTARGRFRFRALRPG
ncbi:MAG: class I SAM-dependent methyltransferase [Euzebyaceae bacterium]|nr:class I SAM-dependent methyltransferase [Euzebyaceae bacterium]